MSNMYYPTELSKVSDKGHLLRNDYRDIVGLETFIPKEVLVEGYRKTIGKQVSIRYDYSVDTQNPILVTVKWVHCYDDFFLVYFEEE